jgi:hypothetical protein
MSSNLDSQLDNPISKIWVPVLIGLIGIAINLVIVVIAIFASGAYWSGQINQRVDSLEAQVSTLQSDHNDILVAIEKSD